MPAFEEIKPTHNDVYPAINPTNPSLSTANKSVVITGGGAGLGLKFVEDFALSGSTQIAITGRTESTLQSAKTSLEKKFPNLTVLPIVADITNFDATKSAFSKIHFEFGKIDIVVHNASYLADLVNISDAKFDIKDWWSGFETNILGTLHVAQAYAPYAPEHPIFLHLGTAAASLPPTASFSSYQLSKLASSRLIEDLQVAYPTWRLISVHPGVHATDMNVKTMAAGFSFPYDKMELPGAFLVWAASPEAEFLKGKFVWAHWDVDELKAKKDVIESTNIYTWGHRVSYYDA